MCDDNLPGQQSEESSDEESSEFSDKSTSDQSSDEGPIHITLMVQSAKGGNKCIRLEVDRSDSVRKVLRKYLAPSELGTELPRYLERAFYVGEEVKWNAGQTFGQSNIRNRHVVHSLLSVPALRVLVLNLHTRETWTLDTLASVTVRKLKMMIREKQLPRKRIPINNMMLKFDEGLALDDDLTLADYYVENDNTLQLSLQYAFKVRLQGRRVKLEQIRTRSQCTIFDLKRRVLQLGYCIELRQPILRGAVRSTGGTYLYLYFDLFTSAGETMRIFVDESNEQSSVSRFSLSVTNGTTIRDIYRKLKAGRGRGVDESQINDIAANDLVWPKCYTFDRAWTRTFMPQIEAEPSSPLSEGEDLNLFFFCFKSKIAELNKIGSCDTVCEIKNFVCERDGVLAERIFCMVLSGKPLVDEFIWYDYHGILQDEFCCFLLMKPEHRSGSMRVYVEWATCVRPIQFLVDPADTVYALKDRIEDDLDVPLVMQKLVFNGEQLKNHNILKACGIVDNSNVQLSICTYQTECPSERKADVARVRYEYPLM